MKHAFGRWMWGTVVFPLFMCGSGLTQPPNLELRLHTPRDGEVLGWGRETPTLVIQASVEEGGKPLADSHLFHTAVVLSNGQLIDRVSLYDDGSHGDTRAGDGIYTTLYRPPKPQAYSVRVRAKKVRTVDGRLPMWEQWSSPVTFYVEPIPYPHIVSPEPGSRVGRSILLRARLLQADQPFTQDDPSLKCEVVWTDERGVQRRVDSSKVRRQRSEITCPIEFEHLGMHRVQVIVQVSRRGQVVSADSVPITIEVAKPPITWLVVGAFMFVFAFLLPAKPAVLLYTPTLEVQADYLSRKTFTITPSAKGEVRRTVGASGCDIVVEGAEGKLCTLTVAPGSEQLTVEAGEGKAVRRGTDVQTRMQVKRGESFSVGGFQFRYADVRPTIHPFPRWHPTPWKVLAWALSVASLAVGLWQYMAFFQE